MNEEGWFKDSVAYQTDTRSLRDSDGDGLGAYEGSSSDSISWRGWVFSPWCREIIPLKLRPWEFLLLQRT